MVSGCVTASLEEAAPKSLSETNSEGLEAGDTASAAGAPGTKSGEPRIRGDRRKAEEKERDNSFVAEGAARDDDFPTFGATPETAADQLAPEEEQRILDQAEAYLKRPGPKLDTPGDVTGAVSPETETKDE